MSSAGDLAALPASGCLCRLRSLHLTQGPCVSPGFCTCCSCSGQLLSLSARQCRLLLHILLKHALPCEALLDCSPDQQAWGMARLQRRRHFYIPTGLSSPKAGSTFQAPWDPDSRWTRVAEDAFQPWRMGSQPPSFLPVTPQPGLWRSHRVSYHLLTSCPGPVTVLVACVSHLVSCCLAGASTSPWKAGEVAVQNLSCQIT
jgi:hypothetical protein